MKIKIFLITVLLTAAVFCISADSYWEGAASMSRYGEFPVRGFYGASNSFPLNSIVEVTNPANNKKAEIIIVNKLDDNNLFLLISKDAAEKLSIKEDDITTVKAALVKKYETDVENEKDLSDDPDFNPSKAVLLSDTEKETVPEEITDTPAEAENDIVRSERDLADEIIETLIISDITEREKVEEPEKTEEAEDEIEITTIIVPDEDLEEKLPETAAEEKIDDKTDFFEKYDPDSATASAAETDTAENKAANDFKEKLVLVPTSPKPPENGSLTEELPVYDSESSEKTSLSSSSEYSDFKKYSSDNNPVETLDSSSYYLQIGAFRDFRSADNLAGRLNLDYPVFLYKKGENGIYRVMAGPLKNDEKGAALYQVRIKGIKDAFIKKGE